MGCRPEREAPAQREKHDFHIFLKKRRKEGRKARGAGEGKERKRSEAAGAGHLRGLVSFLHRGRAFRACQEPSSNTAASYADAQVTATLETRALSLFLIILKTVMLFSEHIRRIPTGTGPHSPSRGPTLHGAGAGGGWAESIRQEVLRLEKRFILMSMFFKFLVNQSFDVMNFDIL